MAFAKAVNLRPDDVPGLVGKAKKPDHDDGSRFRRCVKGVKEAKPVFKESSEEFSAKGGLHFQSVRSGVEIARTQATARDELATLKRILGDRTSLRCFATLFEAELRKYARVRRTGNVTVRTAIGNVRVTPLPLGATVAGTDGGVGLSVAMSVTYTVSGPVRSVKVPTSLDVDVLAFLVGRAGVRLETMTLGNPASVDLETQLFSRLISRARAAGRQYPEIGTPGRAPGSPPARARPPR